MITEDRKGRFFVFVITILAFSVACEGEKRPEAGPENQEMESSQSEPAQSINLTASDLREAALNGNIETVQNAIEQGVDPQEADPLGRTALMFASYNGHTEIVRRLAEFEGNIDQKNSEGRTSLMFAASGPFPETVEFLLQEGADPNAKDSVEGWSPLMYAAAEGNFDVVEVLLEYQADVSLKDEDGETAIDFARNNGHMEVVGLLE